MPSTPMVGEEYTESPVRNFHLREPSVGLMA